MKPRKSKAIVVDASIVHSAGTTENPTSIHCREVLQTILNYCHRVVLTDAIDQEWQAHSSSFALRWRATMTAKKKLLNVADTDVYTNLLEQLTSCVQTPAKQQAVTKDFHLLVAALESDRTIITRDKRLKEILDVAAQQVGELRRLVLANPEIPEDEIIAWLNRGAPADKKRCLGYIPH